jgi:oligopeptide/dipeptide ABC transporter ATP-binding protein
VTALIELRGVTKIFGSGFRQSTVALQDITFSLPDASPSTTAIAGESGSGKTTLARMILGFVKPSEGQVFYRGKDLAKMSGTERRRFRREVQPIFQDPFDVFNPFYRVDHVLTVPIRRFGLAKSSREARRLIDEALQRVGLRPQDTLGRFPHELSGGQRQRVMVARAVLLRPRLIMADEPVSMVDASLRATILDELRTLNRDLGISIVYITHDLTTAYQICDNIIILYQGAVAEAGSVERVIRDPKHPYTQLLVSSIPLPDRTRRWGGEELKIPEASLGRTSAGCRFAPRCPYVMDDCWTTIPPKFCLNPDRLAACFLYRDRGVAPSADVASVFTSAEANSPLGIPSRTAANR